MKKLILFAAIALVAAGCSQTTTQDSGQNNNTQSSLQTYKNGTYGFEFQYPNNMQFVTPTYASLEDKIAQVSIPQSAYPGTNFGDAAFAVSAAFSKTLAQCQTMSIPNGASFKTKVTINGQDFYMAKSTDAAAGNLYSSTVYRTLSGQTCFELNETIHTSNIGNYPPNTVTEVDSAAVQSQLGMVLNTFKFNK